MPGKFYVEGAERAQKVNDLFAAVAPRYDLINDLQSFGLHRLWKRKLIQLAEVRPGEPALDVCCGTGDIAFGLARRGAEVVGLDASEPMLAVARRRSGSSGLEREPRWVCGDALGLPFPDEAFSLVTISYGLRNLANLSAGLAELRRVLRPGGRLLVLDFGKPDNALWRRVYFGYLRWLVPLFGRCFCGDSDTHGYILDSLQKYPGQRGVDAALNSIGFAPTEIHNVLGGIMGIHRAIKPQ